MGNTLYSFFRSGTSHRLRIALNLKGIDYKLVPVNLRTGEHRQDPYLALNPQGLVPAYDCGEDRALFQSPAIIEYLEEKFPEPPLLPKDPFARAEARALAAVVGCDIHPINNLRILNALRQDFGAEEPAVHAWAARWIDQGFAVIEQCLPETVLTGGFAFGAAPGIVEAYLIPQVFSSQRFGVDMGLYPKIAALNATCGAMDAFQRAEPGNQPDAA